MTTFILTRVASRPDGVAGVLLVDDPGGRLPLCVTLEDPWLNNAVGVSCVPAGTYKCVRHVSDRFNTFRLEGVPGRSAILFHSGNISDDTRGCILLGFAFGAIDDRLDIQQSRVAFAAFMEMCKVRGIEEFELRIEDQFGGSTAVTVH